MLGETPRKTPVPPSESPAHHPLLDMLPIPAGLQPTSPPFRAGSLRPMGLEDEIRLRLRVENSVQILVEARGLLERSWTHDIRGYRLLQEVMASAYSRSSETVAYGLVKMLATEPWLAVEEMGRILFGAIAVEMLQLARSTPDPLAFRLEPEDSPLASIPWELGILALDLEGTGSTPVRKLRIYRGSTSSEHESSEDDRLEKRRRSVSILQPSAAAEERSHRDGYYGQWIAKLYERSALEVKTFENPSLADITRATEVEPTVIHVRARFKEASSHGGVQLDFSGDGPVGSSVSPEMRESEALSPSMLARMLNAMKRTPTLILDTYRPAGDIEIFRQLLLRNAFATALRQTPGAPPIVATGLFPAAAQELAYEILIRSLATGRTLGDSRAQLQIALMDQVHEALSEGLHGHADIAAFAVGLFIGDPNLRPVPPR
jgi:hypothetical protein